MQRGRQGTCIECGAVVYSQRWPLHVNWHIAIILAIAEASQMFSRKEIDELEARHRMKMEGKFSVVY